LVEAGGVEPTVRKKDHKSFSERRLQFKFRAFGGRSRPPWELSRWESLWASENWPKSKPV